MRPQRLPPLWQRTCRPGAFYVPTLHEPTYLLARLSGARRNQHRHRLLQTTAYCILLQPFRRKSTQPVLQSPSQSSICSHAFTRAACAGRAGLSRKRHTTSQPKLLFAFMRDACTAEQSHKRATRHCEAPLGLPSAGCTITWSKAHSWAVKRHLGYQTSLASASTKRRSRGERRPCGGATKTAALGGGCWRRVFWPRRQRRPPLSHLALERLCREGHELLHGCLRGVFLFGA